MYALVDPDLRWPFYVGKGCGKRAKKHLYPSSRNSNSKKNAWIEAIRSRGKEPEIWYFQKGLNEAEAYETEVFLAKGLRDAGFQLTNIAPPGTPCGPRRVGISLSESHRANISQALKSKNRALTISEEVLRDLYLIQDKTKQEIASLYGVSLYPVNRLLAQYRILKLDTWASRRSGK